MRARAVLRWGSAVVLASMLGLGSLWVLFRHAQDSGTVQAGAWQANLRAGSEAANMVERAVVARVGFLALNRSETIYFVARTDSLGQSLRSECSYEVVGKPPSARWWSITAYAADYFLFPDSAHRYSVTRATAPLDSEGRFRFSVGAVSGAEPWLPSHGRGQMYLTLRLYQPARDIAENPATLDAPRIQQVGDCR